MPGEIVNKGRVVELEGPMARVRTVRSEACAMCAARGICHPFGQKTTELLVKNTIQARPGQEVQLVMRSSSLLTASFLLYLVPLGFVIGSAVGGRFLADATGWFSPDTGLLVCVALGLLISFFTVKFLARRLERSKKFEVQMAQLDEAGGPGAG
ncbi:MAG: hypothetical protein DRH70_00125 [Candidatus Coatesbacteria bacterium]|nr:MAG: hypothetical protein DRH70_00125 [Candidatus Coatesbacteria bacterium]